MSKPKPIPQPRTTLPAPIPTASTGELACDPDPDPGGFLTELQDGAVSRARQLVNTPDYALKVKREREEELEHEQHKAAIWAQANQSKTTVASKQTKQRKPASPNPRGRQTTPHARILKAALLVRNRLPAKAASLAFWLKYLDAKGITFEIPDTEPPRRIPYPDALTGYRNTVYKRIKRILGPKLLPGR